jgi:hypothetical protein
MKDLVCLVADKDIEATMNGILTRHQALGICPIEFEVLVHPQRDPGCFHRPEPLLESYRAWARYALIVFDQAWTGAPAGGGIETERLLEKRLRDRNMAEWARPVVIEPELEVWVFADSPHVSTVLGWKDPAQPLRAELDRRGLWPDSSAKPPDPKATVEWALRQMGKPRSSALYGDLASRVSLSKCGDRSFLRLRSTLSSWFPPRPAE